MSFAEKPRELFEVYEPLYLRYKEALTDANESILNCEDLLGCNWSEFVSEFDMGK